MRDGSARGRVDAAIRATARWGLGDTGVAAGVAMDSVEWSRLIRTIRDERLEGPFARLLDDGALAVDTVQRAEAERAHVEAMALAVRIDDVIRTVAPALNAANVPVRVLKGPSTARLDHEDLAMRSYGDADLLVPTSSYRTACEVLHSLGFERRTPEFAPGFDSRFAKAVTFVSSDGLEIDLHRTIIYGPFAVGIAERDLWRPGATLDVGGAEVEALDRDHRFVHACVHAAIGSAEPRLSALRDVAVIGSGPVDPARVSAIAAAWRIEPVVARASSLLRSYLGIGLEWMPHAAGSRPRDFRLRCSLDDRHHWSSATVGLLVALPSWSERLALARMLSTSLRTKGTRSVGTRVGSFVGASLRQAAPSSAFRPTQEVSLR